MTLVVGVAAVYASLSGVVWTLQRAMIFPAPHERLEPSFAGGTLVRIPGTGGRTVHAFHVPASAGLPTIVHFHGNGEALADQVHLAASFRAHGLGIFAVEYPGYGLSSDASPSESAIYEDAETAIVHLRDALGVDRKSTVLEGQSLGTGVAVEMAARGHGAKLVLVSPFTSIVDMGRRMLPFLPVRWLVRDRFDNASKIGALTIPILVSHGTNDEVIPFSMGERISKLARDATFVRLPGAHHNDVWQFPALLNGIVAFVRGDARSAAR